MPYKSIKLIQVMLKINLAFEKGYHDMNTSDLVKYLSNNQSEAVAEDLIYFLNINAEKQFNQACKATGRPIDRY